MRGALPWLAFRSAALALVLLGCPCLGHAQENPAAPSYLYQPAFSIDYSLRQPAEPYIPQPGDIFIGTDNSFLAKCGHWLAFAWAPQHSGIVFAGRDGRPMLLEGGPKNTLHCGMVELIPELTDYAAHDRVWIRRRCVPLTPEQSAALTDFAQSMDGRRFGLMHMLAQLTPFRCRGPWRTNYLGKSNPEGNYYCSELVFEACIAAGLLDASTTRPGASFPRDLFFGHSRNRYINAHLDMSHWLAPARWTPCPGAEPCIRRHSFLDRDTDR